MLNRTNQFFRHAKHAFVCYKLKFIAWNFLVVISVLLFCFRFLPEDADRSKFQNVFFSLGTVVMSLSTTTTDLRLWIFILIRSFMTNINNIITLIYLWIIKTVTTKLVMKHWKTDTWSTGKHNHPEVSASELERVGWWRHPTRRSVCYSKNEI